MQGNRFGMATGKILINKWQKTDVTLVGLACSLCRQSACSHDTSTLAAYLLQMPSTVLYHQTGKSTQPMYHMANKKAKSTKKTQRAQSSYSHSSCNSSSLFLQLKWYTRNTVRSTYKHAAYKHSPFICMAFAQSRLKSMKCNGDKLRL